MAAPSYPTVGGERIAKPDGTFVDLAPAVPAAAPAARTPAPTEE